jgi:hypothetical protein
MFHILQEMGAKRKVSITWVAVLCQFSTEILWGEVVLEHSALSK